MNEKVEETALTNLLSDKLDKSKTKHIVFQTLNMSPYLTQNKNASLSKMIFVLGLAN